MTLKERLEELNGQYVKIGGKRGAGFIFIGKVTPQTYKEINSIGRNYISHLYTKLGKYRYDLKNWDSYVAPGLWAIEDANYKKAMATYADILNSRRARRNEYAKQYGKTSRKYKQAETSIRDIVRTIKERAEFHHNYGQTIENKKLYFQECEALLAAQLDQDPDLSDFDIVEDYMSVDDETYGGRILLIDTWLNGKYWSLSEYKRDALKKLIS